MKVVYAGYNAAYYRCNYGVTVEPYGIVGRGNWIETTDYAFCKACFDKFPESEGYHGHHWEYTKVNL